MALLTVRAAAERLGVGYSTLKQWIYDGRVRTTTTAGGHHRVADSEIERLLARQSLPSKGRRAPRERGVIVSLSGRNQLHGTVTEVNPRANLTIQTIPVSAAVQSLGFSDGALWVGSFAPPGV